MAREDDNPPTRTQGGATSAFRAALTIILFAAALFVVQRLTFTLRFPPFQRTTIWTPGAILFSALLLAPVGRWWIFYAGLCLGAFAAYYGDRVVPVAAAMVGAQFLFASIALGAWGLRLFGTRPPFGSLGWLLLFLAIAIVLVPVSTTAPVELVRFLSGADDIWPVALRSFLCTALGILIGTPALTLTLANGRTWLSLSLQRRSLEFACMTAVLVVVGYFCFGGLTGVTWSPALLYAPLPLLVWSAIRFGLAGVSWALLIVAYQSTWNAVNGHGPFATRSPADSVLQIQFFLLGISLPLMALAAVIEERHRAFSALSQSEREARRQYAQLETIYHTAPVGLAFVDTHLRYVSVNDYLAEINGRTAGEHLGRTVREVLPHLADSLEPAYRQVIEAGKAVIETEVHGMNASQAGFERSWLVSHHPVKDVQGCVLGVNTVVQDITGRKRTEERFRLVVESMPNAIVMVDTEGQVVMANSQCERIFGYLREELVGQPVEILVPERIRADHPGYRASFFASPSARPMGVGRELFGRRKDGSEFPVEIGLTPIQTGDGLVVLSAIVDISERKRSEEAKQELAHAARLALVGELSASIAHEINQPLGAILSNADAGEMLLESATPSSLDELRQILADIRKDNLRASAVIRRLRALLRNREFEIRTIDLNGVISEIFGLVAAEARRRGVALKTEVTNHLPVVQGDKVHVQQVLLNLCLNGMEAMVEIPGAKTLTVRAGMSEDGVVAIAVSDTGPGISMDQIAHVFEPFFSTKRDGMGLGLSISRSLVEGQGGRIWAENNPAGGATFRFTLPVEREEPDQDSRRSKDTPVEIRA